MTRKDLSRRSGVSERYIAQIETGQANISLAMLWKIAGSLGLRIAELFSDGDTSTASPPLQALLARLDREQQGDLRPMAGNDEAMEDLKLILRERESRYMQADYVLDTSGRELADCARELAARCGEHLA